MNRKLLIILILVGLALLLLFNGALAKKSVIEKGMVIWKLTQSTVVDSGTQVDMAEGVFIKGYTIVAKAKAKNTQMVPEGDFRLTFDAFSPYEDMGKQKAGFWYVQGQWTVTAADVDPAELALKHSPYRAEGTVMAELPFDPTTANGNWTGKSVLQMALAAGRWTKGEGTLTFGNNLEGDLFLNLDQWPVAN